MKQLTFVLLLAVTLIAAAGTALAEEATQEVEVGLQALDAPAVDPAAADLEPAALDFPLIPAFGVTEGGTCTPCTSHGQCAVACGGAGACLRDLGGQCGGSTQDKYCFC